MLSPVTATRFPIYSLGLGTLGATGPSTGNTIASAVASGAATTGSILTAMGVSSLAGPIGLGVAAAIGIAASITNLFSGCGQSCIQATNIVNQAEPIFQKNVGSYLAIPAGQRTKSIQAAYLNNFDTLWSGLVQACNQVGGQGGAGCISGREQGACDYKTNQSGWDSSTCTFTPAGTNGSGSVCWNWFVGYRDPIANDPCVVPDPTPSSVISNLLPSGSIGSSSFPIIAVAILAIAGIFLISGDR